MGLFSFLKPAPTPVVEEPFPFSVETPEAHAPALAVTERFIEGSGDHLMNHQKPWAHRLVLYGASEKQASLILQGIHGRLVFGPRTKTSSYQDAFHQLFSTLVTEYIPKRELWAPEFHYHELRLKGSRAVSAEEKLSTISYALSAGALLEIGYENTRPTISGAFSFSPHVHRGKVTRIEQEWFRMESSGVPRNYSFSKVSWALAQEGIPALIRLETPVIDCSLHLSSKLHNFQLKLFPLGELGLVDDYTNKRKKG